MTFRDLLAIWCVSLSVVFMWPQVVRVIQKKTVEGISVIATVHSMSGALLWAIYGIVAGVPSIVLANAVTFIAVGFIIAAQVRYGVVSLQLAIGSQFPIAIIGIVAAYISESFIGVVAIVIGGSAIIPQTIRSARTSHQVGLSALTFAIIAVMSVSWAIYGAILGDAFIVAPNFLVVPCALFICVRAVGSHRRYGRTIEMVAVPAR
ncbi:MAG: SemiSWEET family transporter [Ilumatobacteraceae bacterium]